MGGTHVTTHMTMQITIYVTMRVIIHKIIHVTTHAMHATIHMTMQVVIDAWCSSPMTLESPQQSLGPKVAVPRACLAWTCPHLHRPVLGQVG